MAAKNPMNQAIMALFRRPGVVMTSLQIAMHLKADATEVREALRRLVKRGELSGCNRRYMLPPDVAYADRDPVPTIPGAYVVPARHTRPTGPGESFAWFRPEGAPS